MGEQKIIVNYINPPIPLRDFDYSAVRDGYEEGDKIGFGRTKEDAEKDLVAQEKDNYGECYWCLKGFKRDSTYVFIEGFLFCDKGCEGEYYSDRNCRMKNNIRPLWMDRRDKIN